MLTRRGTQGHFAGATAHGAPQLDDGGGCECLAAARAARQHHDRRVSCLLNGPPLPIRQLDLCTAATAD